jgi:alkanesulfonate monooxygenase SsuD/methylene tetrahydromethanopterin reductase-like flavin-dependent oxidoreductase (luciferase family)
VTREVHLLAFGNTRSAGPWRHPDIDNSTAGVRRRLIEHARTAEAGALDALFFADGLNYGPPATWAYKTTEDFEPLTTTAALSSVTERIGLVVTGSAMLQHPYHFARQLLSFDHLSGGRATGSCQARKYHATGGLYADRLDVLGRGDEGELLTALIRS